MGSKFTQNSWYVKHAVIYNPVFPEYHLPTSLGEVLPTQLNGTEATLTFDKRDDRLPGLASDMPLRICLENVNDGEQPSLESPIVIILVGRNMQT